MRFGLFVPQGWRHGPRRHRAGPALGCHGRAGRSAPSRSAAGSRSGSTTTSTPCPSRPQEATHEAWTLMAAFAAVDQPRPARPDVHLHGLPQPGLPREGRRDRRHHLRRPRRDGHRRRLVRARVAGLRLRLPARGRAARAGSPRASRSCARPVDRPAPRPCTGKHYQVDGAICQPLPLQGTTAPARRSTASRCGSPAAARRRPCGSPRSTPSTPTSTARSRGSAQERVLRGHCADVGRDFDEIVRSANYNVVIGATEAEVQERLDWIRDRTSSAGLSEEVADASMARLRAGPRWARPSRSSRTSRRSRTRG